MTYARYCHEVLLWSHWFRNSLVTQEAFKIAVAALKDAYDRQPSVAGPYRGG